MNGGFREPGRRKQKLILKLQKLVDLKHKQGINASYFLRKFHGVTGGESFRTITTKEISGLISEISQLGNFGNV